MVAIDPYDRLLKVDHPLSQNIQRRAGEDFVQALIHAPLPDRGCGVPLLREDLRDRTLPEIAARFDSMLHRVTREKWVRDSPVATKFVDYYAPMLERDRQEIDHNWKLLATERPRSLVGAPETRYDPTLDGQELTVWMIRDFEHLRRSGTRVDRALAAFNRKRRDKIRLPDKWGQVDG